MKNRLDIFGIIGIGLVMLVSSCSDDIVEHPLMQMEIVDVALSLIIEPEISETKSIVDPEGENLNIADFIHNFWVIQYNGTTDDAMIVGEPLYYTYSQFSDDGQIKLIPSSTDNTVVILANTFDPAMTFNQRSTLKDLKIRWKSVTGPESLFAKYEGNQYLMFSGIDTKTIGQETRIECELKRNIARAKIIVKNSSGGKVTITDWQIKQVPHLSYYVNNYELPDLYPTASSTSTIDYPVMYPSDATRNEEDGSYSFTTYLPVNKRGRNESNTNPGYKNFYAPAGATYFQINGTYKVQAGNEEHDMPISYVFYLGADMLNDFNVLPNHSYEYIFDIQGVGNAEDDYRVKDWGVVDFANSDDEIANCYVINPATVENVHRMFKIPVKRVDEFWGKEYADKPNNTLGGTNPKDWEVKIIISNFDTQGKLTFTKPEGTGVVDSNNDLEYFAFTVAPGTTGNAIVGIFTDSSTQPLWTWHLWITDYVPDEAFSKRPEEGVYQYSVTGGEVHRYDNGIWDIDYAKRFMMDRDLGAPNNYQYLHAGNGSCYYQFGRKDPFFGQNSSFYEGFSVEHYSNLAGVVGNIVEWSVRNPLAFIQSETAIGYWTNDELYNPEYNAATADILWQDPYTSVLKYGDSAKEKSIFDPCPPGYCIPKHGVWNDIRTNNLDKPTTNNNKIGTMERNFKDIDLSGNVVVSYWPYPDSGDPNNVPSTPIYFPLTGYKNGANVVALRGVPEPYIIYQSANQSARSKNFRKTIKVGYNDGGADNVKWWGYAVRCVTVRDVNLN